jgi:hypothetical protein
VLPPGVPPAAPPPPPRPAPPPQCPAGQTPCPRQQKNCCDSPVFALERTSPNGEKSCLQTSGDMGPFPIVVDGACSPTDAIWTEVSAHTTAAVAPYGWLTPSCSRPDDDSCPPPAGCYDTVSSEGSTQSVLAAHVANKIAYVKVDEHAPLQPPATFCTRGLVYLNAIWSDADAGAGERGATEQGFVRTCAWVCRRCSVDGLTLLIAPRKPHEASGSGPHPTSRARSVSLLP